MSEPTNHVIVSERWRQAVLCCESTSARDIKAMIAAMEEAGMPEDAKLTVDHIGTQRIRMYAEWGREIGEPSK